MRLLIDVGGTNIRFATREAAGPVSEPFQVKWDEHASFGSALDAYIAKNPRAEAVKDAALAVAGPIDGGVVDLTNRDVVLRSDDISARLGGARVTLFNDLEAVALALPHLEDADTQTLRAGVQNARATKLAVNVGTGFGGAPVFQIGGVWHALPGEPGYISLQPRDEAERAFFAGRSVIEDYVSGRGLGELRAAHPGHPMLELSSEQFAWHLGRAAGDLAAALGAWGGVYFLGGVFDAWPGEGASLEAFLGAFDNRGLMAERMGEIPLHRITRDSPALLGLAHAA